jgi:galactokinase
MQQMNALQRDIYVKYVEMFSGDPVVVRSPGRINMIGEHTDYNDGFVMPAAINKEAVFAAGASSNGRSIVYSLKYDQRIAIDPANPQPVDQPKWANYLLGVLYQFAHNGFRLIPFNCVFGGDIPEGAGLSSSAAIECGFAYAMNELNGLNVPKLKMITMAQWAEHHYVGVKCGIMDQFASMMGKQGHVILLDCRSLVHRYSPIDLKDHSVILCDTKVKHSLVDSEYNSRRSECEQGVAILKKHHPELKSLRDANTEMLNSYRKEFPAKVYNRCLYVVQEIARVREAADDLQKGNLRAFGKKMFETHEGLSKLYEVSCKELDFLVDHAKQFPEVLGARMMGGGFGGCTINIVRSDFAENFEKHMRDMYRRQFSIDMPAYVVNIEGGTSMVSPDVPVLK